MGFDASLQQSEIVAFYVIDHKLIGCTNHEFVGVKADKLQISKPRAESLFRQMCLQSLNTKIPFIL